MDIIKIAVLAGTTRPKRESIHAAKLVADIGRTITGVEITFVDPVEFTFPGDGNDPEGKDPKYTEIVKNADAFFIVTPEYNHSIPSSLKRMLDSELEYYVHKPVAFAGASSTHWGGVRVVEALVNTVRELGLVATFNDVYFPNVADMFIEGQLKPEFTELYMANINKAYAELIWMAKTLKWGRDNLPRA
jgi:NAD(P)H-dependent FMN reductase